MTLVVLTTIRAVWTSGGEAGLGGGVQSESPGDPGHLAREQHQPQRSDIPQAGDARGEAGLQRHGQGKQSDVDGRGYKVQVKIVYPFFP